MTSRKGSDTDVSLFREKGSQALDLMAVSFDLISETATTTEWLERLLILANCSSGQCVRWTIGQPENAITDTCGQPPALPDDWKTRAEWIVSAANPAEPGLLDDIAVGAGLLSTEECRSLFGPDVVVACMDWTPARIFIVLAERQPEPDWAPEDRVRLNRFLLQVRKSILLHKKFSQLQSKLDVANQILSELPRASISLSCEGVVTRLNKQAKRTLHESNAFDIVDSKLSFSDPEIQSELETQLRRISGIRLEQLGDFAWHTKLTDPDTNEGHLISLRAYRLQDWSLESSAHDRVAVMHVESADARAIANFSKLRAFYDLTNSQAQLVSSLLNGGDMEDAAAAMHVSVNTARSHLRAVYNKLGVNSRSQLLQKLVATTVEHSLGPN